MSSAIKLPSSVGGSAISFQKAFNDVDKSPEGIIPIVHNLNTTFPVVSIYMPDGSLYKGDLRVEVVDSNTININDFNTGVIYSDLWNVSIMSGGLGNDPVSLPTLSVDTQVFGFNGLIKPTVGLSRWYPPMQSTVSSFYASIEVTPTSTVTIQLKKNGVALGGDISIAAGSYKSNVLALNESLLPTDYLTVDIVSGNSGDSLFATVVMQSAPIAAPDLVKAPKASSTDYGFVKLGTGLSIGPNGELNASLPPSTFFQDNYDFHAYAMGTLTASQVIGMQLASKSYNIQGVGYARALTAPASSATFKLKVNGVDKGDINFNGGENVGSVSIPGFFVIEAGDLLQVIAPSVVDPTMADVAIVIGGSGSIALSIPIATTTTLGVVKVGAGLSVSPSGSLSL